MSNDTARMRRILASALVASATALAAPLDTDLPKPLPSAACADCGEVRSVRVTTKELRADRTRDDVRPSGLVATIPLGGGKAEAGSSSRIGKEAVTTIDTWEIIIRLDDGRYRLVNVDQPPEVSVGDKVRVEANGRISPRPE